MPFWVTSWPFKKVPYDIALTCNYGMSTSSFDDVSALQGSFILINHVVSEELGEFRNLKHKNFNIRITQVVCIDGNHI